MPRTEEQYKELIESLLDVISEVARGADADALYDPLTWIGGIYCEGCKAVGWPLLSEESEES